MKRRSPAIIAAVIALGLGLLAYRDAKRTDAKEAQTSVPVSEKSAEEADSSTRSDDPDSESPLPAAAIAPPTLGASRFNLQPDGTPVPPLPEGAPTEVKLGVAIFRYQGAQSPPESRRSKKEAEELAKKAIVEAKDDFIEAVKLGDLGSNENIGWIKRGVLEKSVEYAVFTTDKDTLSKVPIDTPRGYWVIKRVR